MQYTELLQTNCTMYKTRSEKIIPTNKINKMLSCTIFKKPPLCACLESHMLSCMLQKQYNRATY